MSRVVALVERHGGLASRAALLAVTSRQEVDSALREGLLVRHGHGRYALAGLEESVAAAHGVGGVLGLLSAALWHGWEVKAPPSSPQVVVRRSRRLTSTQRKGLEVRRRDLHPDEVVEGICTSVETTLEQCARLLPLDEALCVIDSALRHGLDPAVLRRLVRSVRGPGAARARAVLARGDGRAANPFESCLRHLAGEVDGLRAVPQQVVALADGDVRPDLVDVDLRIVIEADSFAWHGDRAALARDARRYNRLVAAGWLVLRFTWEEVMLHPSQVQVVLRDVVRLRTQLPGCPRCPRPGGLR